MIDNPKHFIKNNHKQKYQICQFKNKATKQRQKNTKKMSTTNICKISDLIEQYSVSHGGGISVIRYWSHNI